MRQVLGPGSLGRDPQETAGAAGVGGGEEALDLGSRHAWPGQLAQQTPTSYGRMQVTR